VLRASKRLLRPGGWTAFLTIFAPRDVPADRRRWARDAAPKYGWSRADHARLVRSAGFVDVEEIDCTADYHATMRAWIEQSDARADELAAVISRALLDERQRERRNALAAIEAGLQRRVMIGGRRPGRGAGDG